MASAAEDNESSDSQIGFDSLGLDNRIMKALKRMGWDTPTTIQATALPLALSGKDLLVQATTGSGKSAIFLLPIIQKLLLHKAKSSSSMSSSNTDRVFALILTPSKELCNQTKDCCNSICRFFSKSVKVEAVDPDEVESGVFSSLEIQIPDILIATPSQVFQCLNSFSAKLVKKVKFLVIDEADGMFGSGFEKQIKTIVQSMHKNFQSIVVSATLSKEVAIIKTLIPQNLALVRLLNQELPEKKQMKQYFTTIRKSEQKFAILLSLFKFNLISGKCLIFCNNSRNSYKLKLFLESFKFSSCVLNDQLPYNSRNHVVEQFNADQYQIVIATDLAVRPFNCDNTTNDNSKKSSQSKPKDKEYSLSRGIDFQNVSVVLNFDMPSDPSVYIHRAGRTARGLKKGTVLSFVLESQTDVLNQLQERLRSVDSNEVPIEEYVVNLEEIEKLGYRVNDVLSSITNNTIHKVQLQEIQKELLQSDKLKKHFIKNPNDLLTLEHDQSKMSSMLKKKFNDISEIPKYLEPKSLTQTPLQPPESKNDTELTEADKRKRKKQLNKETLDYYKKLGLVKEGSKKKKVDPLKNM